jgi:hypothetical protein
MFLIGLCPTKLSFVCVCVSVPDANRVGAQDAMYLAMSGLYILHSLLDIKLASCEEQGPASSEVVLLKGQWHKIFSSNQIRIF